MITSLGRKQNAMYFLYVSAPHSPYEARISYPDLVLLKETSAGYTLLSRTEALDGFNLSISLHLLVQ